MILITMGVMTIPIAIIANTLPDLYPTDEAAVGPDAVRTLTPPSQRRRINPRIAAKEDQAWEEWMDRKAGTGERDDLFVDTCCEDKIQTSLFSNRFDTCHYSTGGGLHLP